VDFGAEGAVFDPKNPPERPVLPGNT